ncbi:F0F1 ATP synthase subunit B family protein [Sulfidibacter corallicola]|uniref:ATP synthase subunit b n=1 Tax=Sulfidibacter corallicola TaxID=2818388 RepID=A0A8A4TYI2_SULCO|nr:ATP synthase F0 subunit B [Sulfidibacter corallicola]QTD54288.1 ATP synthase F0 subunit B [Sulfidibacter corallicola]
MLRTILVCLCLGLPVMAAGGGGHDGGHHFDWAHFAAQTVNTLIFFGTLAYLLNKPIKEFFSNRRKQIQEALELAEKSRVDAKRALDEIEQMKAALADELAQIESQAHEDAEFEKKKIAAEAEQEAARLMEQAKADVEHLRRESVTKLKAFLTDLAMAEAEKVISTSITDADRKKLFAEFTNSLGAKS